jgi:hypothetical protein
MSQVQKNFEITRINDLKFKLKLFKKIVAQAQVRSLHEFSVGTQARAYLEKVHGGRRPSAETSKPTEGPKTIRPRPILRTYPFGIVTKGQTLTNELKCYPSDINDNFEKIEGEGYRWLQGLGLVPSDQQLKEQKSKLEALKALPELTAEQAMSKRALEIDLGKVERIQGTNIDLLAATTLPYKSVGSEKLRLASIVNAWLFIVDNMFDSSNSPYKGNRGKTAELFEAFKAALWDGTVTVPEPPTTGNKDGDAKLKVKTEKFIKGIAEIGRKIREIVPEYLEAIEAGLSLYADGNVKESASRKRTMSGSKSESSSESSEDEAEVEEASSELAYTQKRQNAGAVDFAMEIAFAICDIKIPKAVRENDSWKQMKLYYIMMICYFNDIKSRDKEESEGQLDENTVLLREIGVRQSMEAFSRSKSGEEVDQFLVTKTAVTQVIQQLDKMTKDVGIPEASLFEHFQNDVQTIDAIKLAIRVMQYWTSGHVCWETISAINGRHDGIPMVTAEECAALESRLAQAET